MGEHGLLMAGSTSPLCPQPAFKRPSFELFPLSYSTTTFLGNLIPLEYNLVIIDIYLFKVDGQHRFLIL